MKRIGILIVSLAAIFAGIASPGPASAQGLSLGNAFVEGGTLEFTPPNIIWRQDIPSNVNAPCIQSYGALRSLNGWTISSTGFNYLSGYSEFSCKISAYLDSQWTSPYSANQVVKQDRVSASKFLSNAAPRSYVTVQVDWNGSEQEWENNSDYGPVATNFDRMNGVCANFLKKIPRFSVGWYIGLVSPNDYSRLRSKDDHPKYHAFCRATNIQIGINGPNGTQV